MAKRLLSMYWTGKRAISWKKIKPPTRRRRSQRDIFLAAWDRLLEKESARIRPVLTKMMQHWEHDNDLAGVRGAYTLIKLPEAERRDWQKLWADVSWSRSRQKATPHAMAAPVPTVRLAPASVP
jgi:hypothetical protein